ncbi:MAG: methyltransferase domain-containing protein [Cyclobacteriaceae bacterium]
MNSLIYRAIRKIKSFLKLKKAEKKNTFMGSGYYWKERYRFGGDSGPGSYNDLAEFKASVVNGFYLEKKLKSVIELGCGDGNQATYFNFDSYSGYDISLTAIRKCRGKFKNDRSKKFALQKNLKNNKADLVLSLDVLYHLVELEVFEKYLNQLFNASRDYVIIYSTNHNDIEYTGSHVRHRKFTDWVDQNRKDFNLVLKIKNKFPYKGDIKKGSSCDFYIFNRVKNNR